MSSAAFFYDDIAVFFAVDLQKEITFYFLSQEFPFNFYSFFVILNVYICIKLFNTTFYVMNRKKKLSHVILFVLFFDLMTYEPRSFFSSKKIFQIFQHFWN